MNGTDPMSAEAPVTMTPEMVRALAGLHDLQVVESRLVAPSVVSGDLPLAPLAAGMAVLLIFCAAWFLWRRSPRRRRLRALAALEAGWRGGAPAPPSAAALATLLREAAGQRKNGPMPAGLSGEAWLAWIDRRAPAADRGAFLQGGGRLLLDQPFRAAPPPGEPTDLAPLFALSRRWLRVNG